MKKLTNHTAGPRGINLVGGATHWVEPGAEVSISGEKGKHVLHVDDETFDVAGALPDFGKKGDAPAGDDAELIEAVQQEVADLTKQVADLTKERDETAKSNADLTKQVADLTAKLEAATKK